jgi:8-oxo-dGTP pyrophosphatase MutT (NUDIX family)
MSSQGSVSVLFIKDGLILALSRKSDHADLGLVGGSVEEGESFAEAAIRETLEEVGVRVTRMREVFDHPCREHKSITFRVDEYEGEPRSMEGAAMLWVEPQKLLEPHCSFRKYNEALFKHLEII